MEIHNAEKKWHVRIYSDSTSDILKRGKIYCYVDTIRKYSTPYFSALENVNILYWYFEGGLGGSQFSFYLLGSGHTT